MNLGLVDFSALVMDQCFDIVGRVFKGVPAPTNLKVPPHYFDGNILTIGEERGTA